MTARIAQLVAVFVFLAGAVYAQSFTSRLNQAYDALSGGDYETAKKLFDELSVEDPDNRSVEYGRVTTKYKEAIALFENDERERARVNLEIIKDDYAELSTKSDGELRKFSHLGAANSIATLAKDVAEEYIQKATREGSLATPDEFNSAQEQTKAAIDAYQRYLSEFGHDPIARLNLQHARYLHKQVLQNEPDPQDQPQNEDSEDGESEDGDQQGEDGESGEDQNSDETQDGEENSGEDEQEAEGEEGDTDQTGTGNETRADMSQNDLSRQNIEAILQSLEETNRKAQEELLSEQGPTKIRNGQWW